MSEKISKLITEEQIEEKLTQIAGEISERYKGESVTVICVLKGAVMVMVDLVKKLNLPVEMDFMDVSSYGSGTSSSGSLKVNKDLENSIEGKNVLLVEDIIDSGRTLHYLIEYLKKKNPKSLSLFAMLDKPSRREFDIPFDWKGFEIPDEFVVGYGLDYDQKYRNLPYIGILQFD